ncbi:MAG: hypothetical protein WC359_03170 [Dehalococcoidia bacterium]|jgi:tRNA/tmRNA/rRNA uracil-C5-methylase (TrmA/RlmC/RlmD family)
MRKLLILLSILLLAIVFGSTGCSNIENGSYQRGYEAGYIQGREASRTEMNDMTTKYRELIDKAIKTGYDVGYNKGIDECTKTSGSEEELIKVLSYKLVRSDDILEWVTVVGELQNLSNRKLTVRMSGALLDSNGEIVATQSGFSQMVEPQQRAFFNINYMHQYPKAVDVRLIVNAE